MPSLGLLGCKIWFLHEFRFSLSFDFHSHPFQVVFPIKCSFSLLLFLFINVWLFVHIIALLSMSLIQWTIFYSNSLVLMSQTGVDGLRTTVCVKHFKYNICLFYHSIFSFLHPHIIFMGFWCTLIHVTNNCSVLLTLLSDKWYWLVSELSNWLGLRFLE